MPYGSVATLRQFVRPRETEERCDTCGASLTAAHHHTFDPSSRRIRCACESCAILYSTVHRLIPGRILSLSNLQLNDWQWDSLALPIGLAFFSYSTPAKRMAALYPGPAGAAESLLPLDAWEAIAAANPVLRGIEPDVEALLVNRVGTAREYFIVPIDECYKLAGVIRIHWRGLSGGSRVWGEIANFFVQLRRKTTECPV